MIVLLLPRPTGTVWRNLLMWLDRSHPLPTVPGRPAAALLSRCGIEPIVAVQAALTNIDRGDDLHLARRDEFLRSSTWLTARRKPLLPALSKPTGRGPDIMDLLRWTRALGIPAVSI
jgi:hypothetical protein